ncbi:MAG: M15 family metallopeptidase [Spirochaetota bacterium]|nr:M15 family metallopeptidase [Spirochaetota bacterium]
MKYKNFIILGIILIIPLLSCRGRSENLAVSSAVEEKTSDEDIRLEFLQKTVKNLPDTIQKLILSDTDGFLNQIAAVLTLPEELFLLADKQHSIGVDYKPDDIVMLSDYPDLVISREDRSLCKILIPDLLRMVEDARKEGLTLLISSAYRSYEYQDKLFKWNVEQNGLETAERESARPGTSQHQLGTAIDFGSITDEYAFTPPGMWLLENSWKYGFSLSYPDGYEDITGYRYENWHYRYITPAGTELQRKYFGDIQHYMISFLNNHWNELKGLRL